MTEYVENSEVSDIDNNEETKAACCASDCCIDSDEVSSETLKSEDVKALVKESYTKVVDSNTEDGCCSSSCCGGEEQSGIAENYSDLEGHYKEADYGLGCGIPTNYSKIKEGDIVVDLGSGAGNDAFVARSLVGENGKVIGVDMTRAMVEKARVNRNKLGYDNVEFLLGDIENLPLDDESSDVAISNCVLNLVPDKSLAFSEVHRILKPGGHFAISDIVVTAALPTGVQNAAELYSGCISGAMIKNEYINTIRSVGFKNIQVLSEKTINVPDEYLLRHIDQSELKSFRKNGDSILSITVYAEK